MQRVNNEKNNYTLRIGFYFLIAFLVPLALIIHNMGISWVKYIPTSTWFLAVQVTITGAVLIEVALKVFSKFGKPDT